jgi:hypothetical protein
MLKFYYIFKDYYFRVLDIKISFIFKILFFIYYFKYIISIVTI